MNSFLERLTSVIHWIAFLITLAVAYMVFTDPYISSDSTPLFFKVIIVLIPNTIGWLIKYISTGDSNFFPFGK
ncbi:MAG: hypothetical protein CMD89_00495 [Gammaproteobacteria bacterium]|nr:hypothetical protein [Gammaproteobacteria bacterium]|tara:strand:- start:1429 stop:1647 length:219 start_codon:yes stop_codon:yes gene_type:complete